MKTRMISEKIKKEIPMTRQGVETPAGIGDFLLVELWHNDDAATPWNPALGGFVLCYELELGGKHVRLSAVERYLRRDGALGRARDVSPASVEHRDFPPEDRLIMAVLWDIAAERPLGSSTCRSGARSFSNILLGPRDVRALLPLLARTGRCFLVHHEKGRLTAPLVAAEPLEAELIIDAMEVDTDDTYILSPSIKVDGLSVDIRSLFYIFNTKPIYFIWQGRLYSLKGPSFQALKAMLGAKDVVVVTRGELRRLVAKASSLACGPRIVAPEGFGPEPVALKPVPHLILEFRDGMLLAKPFMDYGGILIGLDSRGHEILDAADWRIVRRSSEDEALYRKELEDHGFEEGAHGRFVRSIYGVSEAIRGLSLKGWFVYGNNGRPVRVGKVGRLRVFSGLDWFDLEGEISFGQGISVPLTRALRAASRGEHLIRLDDGSVGLVPDEWVKKNLAVLGLSTGVQASGRLRIRASQALILEAFLEGEAVEFTDGRFREFVMSLKAVHSFKDVQVPKSFKGRLRNYQKEALGWLLSLKWFGFGGVLADDMGLGKTVEVIAMLAGEGRDNGPSLIIAPTSLLFNWQGEIARFAPRLKVVLYCGRDRFRLIENGFDDADIVLTTYAVLRLDIGLLTRWRFNYAVLDESQAIKNAASITARAARRLRCVHRLCLTGTPIENHLGELWSQMAFLNPGLLGPYSAFDARFIRPAADGDDEALMFLKKIVHPFILRRTKGDVACDLPEKVEHLVRCPMTEGQARVYEDIKERYRAIVVRGAGSGKDTVRFRVLEGLLRLRQVAVHPGLVGMRGIGSGKLKELVSLVERAVVFQGHKALVFSQFTDMLNFVREAVAKLGIEYEYLDGKTPAGERARRVKRFQSCEDARLFLISLKAGGVGLNLTAADYVFLIDPWWNPAVELQAVDRAHRIGQDKKVFTYRLISEGTVEEKVLMLQERKQELVADFFSGRNEALQRLSAEDIAFLFS
ncbi:MAG: DEAD/DEAH box helicase [Dissulfurimicrobium sp.]|uniref:DEAD/DEAH box helicase n=1 Tax=Dissulfurimicrobium TaxID=1769732 RepID=UPI001ED9F0C2|nr:DEAD/DEAH box helicase [Dissulfurimicrobium hydrothermale]UKL14204.1 SNF2 family helicase [Dissulfurimicrobium hydrothermale]